MDQNKQNGFSYANEPVNYQEARKSILSLMRNLNKAKEDMKAISDLDIVVEQFQDRTKEAYGQLCVIVKTCSDIFYTIGQKKCPMPSAKIRNYSHSHNLMSK